MKCHSPGLWRCPTSSIHPGAGGPRSLCGWTGWPALVFSAGAWWLYPSSLTLSFPHSWSPERLNTQTRPSWLNPVACDGWEPEKLWPWYRARQFHTRMRTHADGSVSLLFSKILLFWDWLLFSPVLWCNLWWRVILIILSCWLTAVTPEQWLTRLSWWSVRVCRYLQRVRRWRLLCPCCRGWMCPRLFLFLVFYLPSPSVSLSPPPSCFSTRLLSNLTFQTSYLIFS